MDDFEDKLRERLRRTFDEISQRLQHRPVPAPRRRWAASPLVAAVMGLTTAVAIGYGLTVVSSDSPRPGSRPTPAASGGETPISLPKATASASKPGSQLSQSSPAVAPTPSTSRSPNASRPGCPAAPAVEPPSGIEVELTLAATTVSRGESLLMTLHVRNSGLLPAHNSRDTQEYDVWVESADRTIWRWGFGREFPQPPRATQETFDPGEQQTREVTWDQSTCSPSGMSSRHLPAGRYRARALWATRDGGWWSNPVEFEIG